MKRFPTSEMSQSRHATTCNVVILTLTLALASALTSSVTSSASTSASSDRSVAELLASVEQKLGFVLHSQGGIHQLHYAVTRVSRRLDNVEVRMARLEHRLDTKLDGLKSVAHGIVEKMAMLEAQGGVQAQNVAFRIERTETNVLAALDERTANVAAIIDDLGKFVRINVTDRIGATTPATTANTSSSSSSKTMTTTATDNFTADGTYRVPEAPSSWPPSLSMTFNSTEPILVAFDKRLKDLNSDLEIYTRKVLNTYQEMMKESKTIDVSLRKLLDQGNQTRLTVREAFRKLYQHTKPVSSLDNILNSLTKKVTELAAIVDTSFASLLVAQNTFIATCHRVQQQEPVVETRIYHLLHKLVHDIGNKSKTNKEDCGLREAFDSHRKDVGRALNDLVWTVITVGNQTVEDLRKTDEFSCNCNFNTDTTSTKPRIPDAPSTEIIETPMAVSESPVTATSFKQQQPTSDQRSLPEEEGIPRTKSTGSDVLPERLPDDEEHELQGEEDIIVNEDGSLSSTTSEGKIVDESTSSNDTQHYETDDQAKQPDIQTSIFV